MPDEHEAFPSFPYALSDRELVARFPWIPWLEPAKILYTGDGQTHYACRLCIAHDGLRGPEVPALPLEPQPIVDHLREQHPEVHDG